MFHLLLDEGLQFVGLGGEDVEEEFVVNLEGHAGAELARGDLGVDADHGQLDEVSGGALQGRVDGGALGEASLIGVARLDVWDGADAAEAVRTSWSRRTVSSVRSMNWRTPAYRAK